MPARILVVDTHIPTPDQDSGSASAFGFIGVLAAAGHRLAFVPLNPEPAGQYSAALNAIGVETLFGSDAAAVQAIVEARAGQSDIVLLYRAAVANALLGPVRRAAPAARILFHPVDLHFLRLQRQAELTGYAALAGTARAMRAVELDLITRADATIVVSAYEAELLAGLLPGGRVRHIPILRQAPKRGGARFDERRDVLFIGGYRHTPNVDAVHWLAGEIWPRVRALGYGDRLVLAGSHMPPELAALASPSIEVRGHVSDLGEVFDRCRLSIAPLRYGAGLKGKIVTSLSYGVPMVATRIAVEGSGLVHGETVLVADGPAAMAAEIVRLYGDAGLWQRLSVGGLEHFRRCFSVEAVAPRILAAIEGLLPT
jgi:glycosyltransferase involved in cell wall biosynthesis